MKIEKVGKLLASLHNKAQYVIHIRNLKKSIKSMDYYWKNCIESLNLIKKLG